jgi:hypothetical protein
MATDTEFRFIRCFQGGVKTTPEKDACNESYNQQAKQRIFCAGLFKERPDFF